MKKKSVRITTSIKVDPEVWQEAKIEAIRQNKKVAELVEESLMAVIKKNKV